MNTIDLLFVYGTLRRDTRNEMYHLLAHHASFVCDATYQGIMYLIGEYPGVIPSRKRNDMVKGELYRLPNPHDLLAKLDEYEECGSSFKVPTEYVREIATVTVAGGGETQAWIYIYNFPTVGLPRIESGDFLHQ